MSYARQINMAKRLIAAKGQPVTWRAIRKVPNPTEPWKPTNEVPVDNAVLICFLPINKETRETLAFMGKSEVSMSNEMGLMGSVPFEPSTNDVVIRNGKELRIDSMQILRPDGTPVLYTVVFK